MFAAAPVHDAGVKVWPVIISLFGPGVGQALVARPRASGVFAGAFVLAMLAIGFSIYALPLALGVYAASVVDMIVHTVRTRTPSTDATLAAAITWVLLVAASFLVRTFVAQAFKIPASSGYPALEIGDHVFVSKLRGYGRGDLVVFAQPCEPSRDYVKRVVALAGDTVEVRCGNLFVNGKQVPTKLVEAEETYRDYDEIDARWIPRESSRYQETIGDTTFDTFHRRERPQRGDVADESDFPRDELPSCASQRMFDDAPSAAQPAGELVGALQPEAPCTPQRHYVVPPGHIFVLGDNRSNSNDSRYWGSVPVELVKGPVIGRWLPLGRFGSVE